MGQDVVMPPSINIDNVTLEVVDSFRYLGSTITSNLSLEAEINIRIAKAAAIVSKLNRRVWSNNNRTEKTKLHVYQACVPGIYCSTVVTPEQRMTREETEQFSPLLPQTYPRHLLAGQGHEQRGSGACSLLQHLHAVKPETSAMVQPCPSDG